MATVLLIGLFLFYFGYTLFFAIKFNRTNATFTKAQRLTHNVLIWVIPVFWILVLKSIIRPLPTKKLKSNDFYESEIGYQHFGTND